MSRVEAMDGMSMRDSQAHAPGNAAALRSVVVALLGVLASALIVRLVFFTGFMGSDEIVYTEGAVRFLHGEVEKTNYIGSLRYGVDIPVAFFIWLFGPSVAAASLWGMISSIADVAVVFGCAYLLWGLRAAIFAGILIAFLPLHVIMAGRMLADSPLVFFMSLSFFAFLLGNRRDSAPWFFVAGLAVGATFWVKQAAILYTVAFPIIAIAARRWNWKWFWAAFAALIMLFLNCMVMWKLQGDPFHVFKVSGDGVASYGGRADIDDSAFLYFRYLFLDIRHTWILGFLALAGVWYGFRRRSDSSEHPLLYAGIWAASLVGVFSFAVISLEPLRFVMKQSNYMLLFTAPLCLLGGLALARLGRRYGVAITATYIVGAVVLAGLTQQDIHVFRANSPNALAYARANPQLDVYATTNAYHLALFERTLSGDRSRPVALRHLSDLKQNPESSGDQAPKQRVALIDMQNIHWGGNPVRGLADLPSCWRQIGEWEPAETRSSGSYIVHAMLALGSLAPAWIGQPMIKRLRPLLEAKPVYVVEVPPGCGLPDPAP